MTEKQAPKKKPKLTSRKLRERLGSIPKQVVELNNQNTKLQRQVKKALEDGPKTTLEVSEVTGLPVQDVFWHLMALRKYGEVVEGEERDSYFEYALNSSQEGSS